MQSQELKQLARQCGFELAGVARAEPVPEALDYLDWVARGWAGRMGYLTDRRAGLRLDPRLLLESARSVVCVGKLYQTPVPYSAGFSGSDRGWISRYAWGDDYHEVLREGLERLVAALREVAGSFDYKICVDTAPLLERSYARLAGLGWIGRNTCLIHEPLGSWFFLGEVLVSLDLEPDAPPPDRCGSCRSCVDACPTSALVQAESGRWELDARLCISYQTIELRGALPPEVRGGTGFHVFGCDICQEVCPWNQHAPVTRDLAFAPRQAAPRLDRLAGITEQEFRAMFRHSPVKRARYRGFLRNVALAMGNCGPGRFREPLERLAGPPYPEVAEAARWALARADR